MKYNENLSKDKKALYAHLLPVINQQRVRNGKGVLKSEEDLRKLSPLSVIQLYSHLYKEYRDENNNIVRGLYRDTNEMDEANLTLADRALLKFLNAHYDSFFLGNNALLNQKYTYKINSRGELVELSALDVYNNTTQFSKEHRQKAFSYRDQINYSVNNVQGTIGWIPKIAPTEDELLQQVGLNEETKTFSSYTLEELRNAPTVSKYFSKAYWKL
jgi:hypothetical protein